MKKRIAALLAAILCLAFSCSFAQRIEMEDECLAYDFKDSWLVLSPQLAHIYAPFLKDKNIDGEELSQTLSEQGVAARAYSADFTQWVSVLTKTDDFSQEIFDISRITDAQRKTLRQQAEKNDFWEATGYRTQDTEWQKENDVYWLYIHYTRTIGDQMIGRGIRYVTIRNGMYIELDWQRGMNRFSNRELSSFRSELSKLEVTGQKEEPVHYVRLFAEIPGETDTGEIYITGTTTPEATLVVEAPDENGILRTVSVAQAESSGKFRILVQFEKEGTYELTLTAEKDGMIETQDTGTVVYDAKTLPVTLSVGEDSISTEDKVTITGQTLAGVSMQLIAPSGMTKKRTANDGSFSFELTTKEEGIYQYTLILDRKGYNQRRINFNIERVLTDDQEKQQIRDTAEKIAYKTLQKDQEADHGKVMRIRGPVTEVSEGGGVYYIRMQYSKDSSGKWFNPIVVTSQEDPQVKAGDMLTAVVEVAGVFEEQDSSGETVMIPRMTLDFIDRID